MARCAEDLDLALRGLAGPDLLQRTAWQVQLPPPRRRRLGEFRVAVWASSPLCRIDTSVSDLFDRAINAIVRGGATVDDTFGHRLDFAGSRRPGYTFPPRRRPDGEFIGAKGRITVKNVRRGNDVRVAAGQLITSFTMDQMSPIEYAKNVHVATFIIQVHDGALTKPSDVQQIFDNIPVNDNKLVWIEGTTRRWDGYNYFPEHPKQMIEWFDTHTG